MNRKSAAAEAKRVPIAAGRSYRAARIREGIADSGYRKAALGDQHHETTGVRTVLSVIWSNNSAGIGESAVRTINVLTIVRLTCMPPMMMPASPRGFRRCQQRPACRGNGRRPDDR